MRDVGVSEMKKKTRRRLREEEKKPIEGTEVNRAWKSGSVEGRLRPHARLHYFSAERAKIE